MAIYILDGEEKKGPYNPEEVESFLKQGLFTGEELAWRDGLTDWIPLRVLQNRPVPSGTPPIAGAVDADEEEDEEESDVDPEAATEKQKELLRVYGVEFAEGISKTVALGLLRERDLSQPISAQSWQSYQTKFPAITTKRTRSERVDDLLQEILQHHDVSYWTPDDESVREILDYVDHRFKGWERRTNAYDLIDRAIHAFYPPPDQARIEGTEAKKSIVVEKRKKQARRSHVQEGTGIVLIAAGLILGVLAMPALSKQIYTAMSMGCGGAAVVCLALGFRFIIRSRSEE